MTHARKRIALLVAESGGHLEQLVRLEPRLHPRFHEVIYVTGDTAQSRSLLEGRAVSFERRVAPRDVHAAARSLAPATRLIRRHGVTDVVSTGSAVAVPYLVAARTLGVKAHYIESAARTSGPSLSGRILRRVPGVNLYCQYGSWSDRSWRYEGSVFDGFHVGPREGHQGSAKRIVVTLGTLGQYPFTRAVEAVERILGDVATPDCDILWQVGGAPVNHVRGEVHDMLPAKDLRQAINEADVVFAHAGTGSCLQILDSGRVPVLLPRSPRFGEHIDDHQQLIAQDLHDRGLAIKSDPDLLAPEHAFSAMSRRVRHDPGSSTFSLHAGQLARRPVSRLLESPSRFTARS